MITPLEIEQKEFSRVVRGYKEEEVDTFLNLIILEMENLIAENEQLKEDNTRMKKEIITTKNSEEEVLSTLETAKRLMAEISESAEKRADMLLRNAEMDAQLIRREAAESTDRFVKESGDIRNRVISLRDRYRSILEDEIMRFDALTEEIFTEADDIVNTANANNNRSTRVMRPVEEVRIEDLVEEDVKKSPQDMKKTMVNIR